MISVKRYSDNDKELWNRFNKSSKMPMFMFDRNYMDYHRDRFKDSSFLIFNDEDIIALFPACEIENVLFSHGGLTFGGLITDTKMKQHTMNDCFDAIISTSKELGYQKLIYKAIPHFYHNQPAEEDRYSLYANGGKLVTIDASTVISLNNPIKMPKGRKAQISRAKREGVAVEVLTELKDYEEFIELENLVLQTRHNTRAVHTARELKMLHDSFPNNIHLFGAKKNGEIIAGTVVYEYDNIIHTQYMAANEEARIIGALDLAVASVIERYSGNKEWIDFGISTEHGRVFLNEGLIAQKEGFGGRTGIYEIWELQFS